MCRLHQPKPDGDGDRFYIALFSALEQTVSTEYENIKHSLQNAFASKRRKI